MTAVKVRLFAALRDLAGASEVDGAGTTAGDVLDDLCARYGDRFATIARAGSIVVEGERAAADRPLADGDTLALLPPVSGG
jgi:sulfur-carrier protein